MTELVRYEAARRALEQAVAVDEVAEIHRKADAMRHYARQAADRELEIKAAQIRFRAERRLGELLIAAKDAGQISRGQPKKKSAETEEFSGDEAVTRVTLREAGIDHKLSSKAQRTAAMDAADFEQALKRHEEEMRTGAGRVAMDLHKIGSEERGREHRRQVAETLSAASAALPSGRKYPVIYADPPWRRHQGINGRSYENHYPTMTWQEICALPIADMVLPDAWLFLWIPRAHLFAEIEIEREITSLPDGERIRGLVGTALGHAVPLSWGFDAYSTCCVWTKTDAEHPDAAGSGLIYRDQDELLLLFKRGAGLPMPEADKKFGSNYRERPREHSRKPDFYRHMIETMTGGLPVLELFARVDAEHPLPNNWSAWGNQATETTLDDAPAHREELADGVPGETHAEGPADPISPPDQGIVVSESAGDAGRTDAAEPPANRPGPTISVDEVDELEAELLEAMHALAAGKEISGQDARQLIGNGWAHATTKAITLTDDGRAVRAQWPTPAAAISTGERVAP